MYSPCAYVNAGLFVQNLGMALALLLVNFDFCHAPNPIAYPNPGLSVNEVEDPGAIVGNVRLEKNPSRGWQLCEGGVAPPTQEVSCVIVIGVWWNGTDVIVCILMLSRLCYVSGNVCGLLVVSQTFIENII